MSVPGPAGSGKPRGGIAAGGHKLVHALHSGLMKRLQALNGRERWAIVSMLLAVLTGLELLWITPMHAKRVAIEQATQQQEASAIEAEQARLTQQSRDATALQVRLATADQALERLGSARTPQAHQSLGAWLDQALAGQAVHLIALRDLEPQIVSLEQATTGDASPDAALAAMAPGTPGAGGITGLGTGPAAPPAPLHRLRFELQLAGEPAALAQATQTLAERLAPLRLARVHLARTEAGAVQATLLFVILAPEREWIRL
jgi:hypothetical protein